MNQNNNIIGYDSQTGQPIYVNQNTNLQQPQINTGNTQQTIKNFPHKKSNKVVVALIILIFVVIVIAILYFNNQYRKETLNNDTFNNSEVENNNNQNNEQQSNEKQNNNSTGNIGEKTNTIYDENGTFYLA